MGVNMDHFMNKLKKSDFAEKISLIIALALLVVVFSVFNKNYLTVQNFINILVACSLTGFVAIAETNLIIANQIDLSAGSVAAFSGVLGAVLVKAGFHPVLAILAAVLAGCVIGAFNAVAVNFLNLQPFIATLATMSIVRGFAYIICGGKAVAVSSQMFIKFGTFRLFGIIPLPVIILIVAFLVFGFVLKKTFFGRSIYVLGGNPYAARLAGLSPMLIRFKLYIMSGGLAALAGVLLAARMNSGQPSACNGLEFDAATAAVLGGTAFTGGVGTMLGTFIGMLILQCFNTGLVMLNVQVFWQNVAQGSLLVVALAFDFYRKRMRSKKLLEESMKVTAQP
ncbi:ABC transporter permease [Clostridium transplantifaecale]|uniref:ABC transporter permease n=1 Tax=Clostridium transplantifaecale TaxID=2479838 RepID=UPI001FAA3891|nr:ABC transporter permease [Clostridium transplantifaecale]